MKYYEETFKEVNSHIRESDKKRDQIVAFYGILIAAFMNSLDKIGDLRVIASVVLALIGLGILIVILNLRRHHILYMYSAQAVQLLWASNAPPTRQNAVWAWSKFMNPASKYMSEILNPLRSTEAAVYNTYLAVWFLPLYTAIPTSILPRTSLCQQAVTFMLLLTMLLVLGNAFAYYKLRGIQSANVEDLWLLRFSQRDLKPEN